MWCWSSCQLKDLKNGCCLCMVDCSMVYKCSQTANTLRGLWPVALASLSGNKWNQYWCILLIYQHNVMKLWYYVEDRIKCRNVTKLTWVNLSFLFFFYGVVLQKAKVFACITEPHLFPSWSLWCFISLLICGLLHKCQLLCVTSMVIYNHHVSSQDFIPFIELRHISWHKLTQSLL